MERWGARPEACVHLGDDDNDLDLAALVPRVFVPRPTSETMAAAAAADPTKFEVVSGPAAGSQVFGPQAADEMMRRVLGYMRCSLPEGSG